MHPKIVGHPDIILKDKKVAIFIHGCFWHKCPKCYKEPKSRKKYWVPKLERNVKRDIVNTKMLRKNGYKTIVTWEHDTNKNLNLILRKILE